MVKRYEEVFNSNHSQECICHRRPMFQGIEERHDGSYVDFEEYEKLQNQLAKTNERIAELEKGMSECATVVTELIRRGDIQPLMKSQEEIEKIVNKFAIDQKIKAVIFYGEKLKELGFSGVDSYTEQVKDMLRKEQSDG